MIGLYPVLNFWADNRVFAKFSDTWRTLTIVGTGSFLRERLSILNAYFFPSAAGWNKFHPTISPVNTFRLIFMKYMISTCPC